MSKPKGVARAAKELRRQQAEERNATTQVERQRVHRDGPPASRRRPAASITTTPAAARPVTQTQPTRRPRPAAPTAVPRVAGQPITLPGGRKPPAARTPPVPTRVHVAPRRITDGLKADHAARAVSIGDLFPAPTPELAVLDEALQELAEVAPCDLCHGGPGLYQRGPHRLCTECRDWADYWDGLTPEEQAAEQRSMDAYVAESADA